jgi:hypothetical protein
VFDAAEPCLRFHPLAADVLVELGAGLLGMTEARRARGKRRRSAKAAGGSYVTAPFRLDAFAYATKLSENARRAGASNCLKFERERVIAEFSTASGHHRQSRRAHERAPGAVGRRGRRRHVERCCPSWARSRKSWCWPIAPWSRRSRWARNSGLVARLVISGYSGLVKRAAESASRVAV